jgi:hypothetical protein
MQYTKHYHHPVLIMESPGYYTYRESTKHEFAKLFSDSCMRITPSQWFRHQDVKRIRSKSKQELLHYYTNNYYEPIIPTKNVYDVWWNWD